MPQRERNKAKELLKPLQEAPGTEKGVSLQGGGRGDERGQGTPPCRVGTRDTA